MKISCQSCQSKYNVADEKVQGKIVKIRCRKCGATIVVNATSGVAANGSTSVPPAEPAGGGGAVEGEWHVSVSDNDQRTMTLAQLVDAYNTGVVAQDTFIWTEGMGDWKPLADVDAVVSALHAAAAQSSGAGAPAAEQAPEISAPLAAAASAAYEAPAAPAYEAAAAAPAYEAPAARAYEAPAARAYEAPVARAYEAPVAAAPTYARPNTGGAFAVQGAALHGAAAAAAAPVEARRANVVRRDARARDLFATRAGEDLQAGASANGEDDSRLTGQRNENSVLFSLDVLTKNSEQQHAPPPAYGGSSGTKDDSGLIDLKALAAKAESMRPPTMHEIAAPSPLGVASPLGFAAPLGGFATGAEAQPKSRLPLLIGAGAGVALLLVLGIVIGLKIGGAATPAAMPSASAFVLPPLPSATETPAASASATAVASASASAAPVAAKPHYGGGGAWKPGGAKPAGAGGASGAAGAAGAGASTGAGAAAGGGGGGGGAAPPKKNDCGCNGDLMCMMRCSTH